MHIKLTTGISFFKFFFKFWSWATSAFEIPKIIAPAWPDKPPPFTEHFTSYEFKTLETKHKNILKNYFNQEWQSCLKEMNTAKSLCNNLMNEYYEIMTQRIDEFRTSPPPKDWDGVYVATSK